jgi:hypothetical protein
MSATIERLSPRENITEEPYLTSRGYCLADPKKGRTKHHAANAVFVKSIEEAAELVLKGYSIRMTSDGRRPSLVAPSSLRIVRS